MCGLQKLGWVSPPKHTHTPFGHNAEIWGLGVMAFKLYAGKIPWLRGDDDGEFATILGLSRIIGSPTNDKWPGIEDLPRWGPIAPKLEQLSAGAPEEAPPPARRANPVPRHPPDGPSAEQRGPRSSEVNLGGASIGPRATHGVGIFAKHVGGGIAHVRTFAVGRGHAQRASGPNASVRLRRFLRQHFVPPGIQQSPTHKIGTLDVGPEASFVPQCTR